MDKIMEQYSMTNDVLSRPFHKIIPFMMQGAMKLENIARTHASMQQTTDKIFFLPKIRKN